MTKSEYMEALREKLQKYNSTLAQEILEDYEMHFTEGLASGQSEEEIIRELGNVDDMLAEFTEEDLKGNLELARSRSNLEQQYGQLYKAVVIDGLLADIEVTASDDGHLNISYQNNGNNATKLRYHFYQYEKDGIFYAGVEDTGVEKQHGSKDTGMKKHRELFELFPLWREYSGNITLTAEIPAGIPALMLSTSSGDLQVDDLKLSKDTDAKLELKSGSGDVEISNVSANTCSVKTASGDIELSDLEAMEIMLQCSSGDIEGSQIHCGRLTAEASSGDIELMVTAESCDVKTSSGDIELELTVENCDVKTASGDIELEVSAGVRQINLLANSGDIELDLTDVAGATIETTTNCGDVSIQGKSISDRHSSSSYGDGSCKVSVCTSSGDITIQ